MKESAIKSYVRKILIKIIVVTNHLVNTIVKYGVMQCVHMGLHAKYINIDDKKIEIIKKIERKTEI